MAKRENWPSYAALRRWFLAALLGVVAWSSDEVCAQQLPPSAEAGYMIIIRPEETHGSEQARRRALGACDFFHEGCVEAMSLTPSATITPPAVVSTNDL